MRVYYTDVAWWDRVETCSLPECRKAIGRGEFRVWIGSLSPGGPVVCRECYGKMTQGNPG